jgi:hypothetical protein
MQPWIYTNFRTTQDVFPTLLRSLLCLCLCRRAVCVPIQIGGWLHKSYSICIETCATNAIKEELMCTTPSSSHILLFHLLTFFILPSCSSIPSLLSLCLQFHQFTFFTFSFVHFAIILPAKWKSEKNDGRQFHQFTFSFVHFAITLPSFCLQNEKVKKVMAGKVMELMNMMAKWCLILLCNIDMTTSLFNKK